MWLSRIPNLLVRHYEELGTLPVTQPCSTKEKYVLAFAFDGCGNGGKLHATCCETIWSAFQHGDYKSGGFIELRIMHGAMLLEKDDARYYESLNWRRNRQVLGERGMAMLWGSYLSMGSAGWSDEI